MNLSPRSLVLSLVLAALGISSATLAADPTEQEQYFVYEINRARSDPPGWALEMGIDSVIGGDGNPTDLEDVAASPPLALNELLVDSARFHAVEMADHDYFAHESVVTGDFPNEMVRDAGYPLPPSVTIGFFTYPMPDASNQVESIAAGVGPPGSETDFSLAMKALLALIVDDGVPSLGHRNHLLSDGLLNSLFTEVGAGFGFDGSSTYHNYWAIHTGLETGFKTFVTGVVYDDANSNDLYDPGEGLSGVSVEIGALSDTTNAAGGYSIEVSAGNLEVSCSGGLFSGSAAALVEITGVSREVDFQSGEPGAFVDFVAVPESSAVLAGAAALATLGAIRRKRRA